MRVLDCVACCSPRSWTFPNDYSSKNSILLEGEYMDVSFSSISFLIFPRTSAHRSSLRSKENAEDWCSDTPCEKQTTYPSLICHQYLQHRTTVWHLFRYILSFCSCTIPWSFRPQTSEWSLSWDSYTSAFSILFWIEEAFEGVLRTEQVIRMHICISVHHVLDALLEHGHFQLQT